MGCYFDFDLVLDSLRFGGALRIENMIELISGVENAPRIQKKHINARLLRIKNGKRP